MKSIIAVSVMLLLVLSGCGVESAAQIGVEANPQEAEASSADAESLRDGKSARDLHALKERIQRAEVVLADDFDRDSLGDGWVVEEGSWKTLRSAGMEREGVIGTNGEKYPDSFLWTRQSFEGDIVVEFTAECLSDPPNDINVVICGKSPNYPPPEAPLYLFGLGGWKNTMSGVERAPDYNWKVLTRLFTLQPRTRYHVQAVRVGDTFTLLVDGRKIIEAKDADPLPASGQVALHVYNSRVCFSNFRVRKPRPI